MGVDKESSRNGGGYVGGFFQLFDWTAKSRKKLFSSKSDFPEQSKQGKRSDGNLPMTRLRLTDEDKIRAGTSIKGSSDNSCASSVTDDDIYGTRPPNVVARLMGLDSLPTYTEPYSSPLFDDAHFRNRNLSYHHDQQVVYPGDLFNKIEGPARNFVESKPQKTVSKPIEKFQIESLPPKAAKTIPITHHKLLSPIKSPGFIPTKNAAYVMETAARIIQPSPHSISKSKMPLVGSSSVPVKVRDFKERMEAVQKMPPVGSSSVSLKARDLKEKAEATHKTSRLSERTRSPVESNAAKYLKGQSMNKSWNGSTETSPRTSDTEEISSVFKSKGKPISLAIQAKVNVQKREGLASSSNQSLLGPKEQSEVKCSQPFKSQPSTQMSLHKKPLMHNCSGVLMQNNQKQNSIANKDKLPSKHGGSNSQSRKVFSGGSAFEQHRMSGKTVGNSETGSRKLALGTVDGGKGGPSSDMKNPRKKTSKDRNIHFEKNQVVDSVLIEKKQKEDRPVTERNFSWVEDSKKKGMDVVSFTFTSPLTCSMETSAQVAQKNSSFCMDNHGKRLLLDTNSMKSSSSRYNVIGGDALSMLLEQKLRELTNAVESSNQKSLNSVSASNSMSFSQELGNSTSSLPRLHDKLGSCYGSNLSSADLQLLRLKQKLQGGVDECSSSPRDAWQPSPVSILEPLFSTESCNSSDSTDSFSIEGSKQCSSVQAQEVLGLSSLKKQRSQEADTELSDSASSMRSRTVAKSNENFVMSESMKLVNWELEYVKQILCNVELMFKDFSLGRAYETINPHLFDQLESRRGGFGCNSGELRLDRKALFDSVSECIDSRCRQSVSGGYKMWTTGMMILRRNERLAEEVYKEICGWRGMGDCMVDELVDKDMSSQHGKWLDFEVDAFVVVGADIEGQILSALIDEVITELLTF
ncbi:hypothetical protein F3Y22_tig00110020pilonHSYRG00023 [Hibiscus syriacus]|uniref:Protein FAR1-RELATED SEQUENCE 11-like n=1 Tax=Hibiscus syriacus TaxID=106335 RepID=A0A6A3BMD5_HIBSY|nr:uncharacterized protein LOC120213069 [Hibiscus syriacus]KAE8717773.1 hypothetical protein F3Y22_tig00110020pilonHSYRG00023 [Hibiscus syriacus]